MKKNLISPAIILCGTLIGLLSSCDDKKAPGDGTPEASQPGGMEAAKALVEKILSNQHNTEDLTSTLQPTTEDLAAVFEAEFAETADTVYSSAWGGGVMKIIAKPGQTELVITSATSEDLKAWNDKASEFPGGYQRIAANFKDGITIYRFKFVKPGESTGMAYDGLIHVNGNWRWMPKPWRIEKEPNKAD